MLWDNVCWKSLGIHRQGDNDAYRHNGHRGVMREILEIIERLSYKQTNVSIRTNHQKETDVTLSTNYYHKHRHENITALS